MNLNNMNKVYLIGVMQEWSDLQNAALIERVKELENKLTELKEKHKRDVMAAWKEAKNDVREYMLGDITKSITAEQYYKQTHEKE